MEQRDLVEQIQLLHEIHSRRLSDRGLMEWADNLREFSADAVRFAIKAGCRERVFPGLGWVLEACVAHRRRAVEEQKTRAHLERVSSGWRDEAGPAGGVSADEFFAKLGAALGVEPETDPTSTPESRARAKEELRKLCAEMEKKIGA